MRLQNGDYILQLIQVQGLDLTMALLLELVRMELAMIRPIPSFVEGQRELAFDIVNGAGGQRPHTNVSNTLDIPSRTWAKLLR